MDRSGPPGPSATGPRRERERADPSDQDGNDIPTTDPAMSMDGTGTKAAVQLPWTKGKGRKSAGDMGDECNRSERAVLGDEWRTEPWQQKNHQGIGRDDDGEDRHEDPAGLPDILLPGIGAERIVHQLRAQAPGSCPR